MLLEKTGAGTWIAVTPDGDIKRIDLNVVLRIPLERRSQFPRPQAPYVYAFDPIPRENLDSYHRRARAMANLFNDAGVADVEAVEWLVADITRADFRAVVSDEAAEEGVILCDSALVEIYGEGGLAGASRSVIKLLGYSVRKPLRETSDSWVITVMAKASVTSNSDPECRRCGTQRWRTGRLQVPVRRLSS